MKNVYTDILPKNYFDNLYEKVSKTIKHGENVCISAIYGQSNKTVYNFLFRLISSEKLFDGIFIYNPILTNDNPMLFTKKIINKNKTRT